MIIKNKELVVVFDLDDTLYKEIDFLKSAYREIANYLGSRFGVLADKLYEAMLADYHAGLNVFESLIKKQEFQNITVQDLLGMYRHHVPSICLTPEYENVLKHLKKEVFKVGLITDGRSIQQRNKLLALGLSDYFDGVIISEEFGSEKPNVKNYQYFVNTYGAEKTYIYIGDNTRKDFSSPRLLGWKTICLLDSGTNIHKQAFTMESEETADYLIQDFIEISHLMNQVL
ncbi:HAD family hydrolase [Mariniflexile sp. AS56]|uniref:HAD family hydrolase n=1 Tax=Mariniflexile sp. AS56 TaxID=3063957 RepID=UPI0026F04E56|nr:HAD family hydrolase [Mariniflexile sp. AS56]MDO7171350.1 HAD family hydrolase [Mariniflexile sp. AS56]